jgi:RNA polymerase sigma-32 factor
MASEQIRDSASDRYMAEISRYQLLSRSEEAATARRYRQTGDAQAAHELVRANLRFVVKIAHEFGGYGLPLMDLIQEGNLGLVVAVKKYDPEKGYRLISYAVWWIRAYMWNCALRSWSMIKIGTTQAQRKLFFVLRSAHRRAEHAAGFGGSVNQADLARKLGVEENDVKLMGMRMSCRDLSLDAEIARGAGQSHLDSLVDNRAGAEALLGQAERERLVHKHVQNLMPRLNKREGYIVVNRLLAEQAPRTLREIGRRFNVSRERARQIEGNVLRKIRSVLVENRDLDLAVA